MIEDKNENGLIILMLIWDSRKGEGQCEKEINY